MASEYDGLDPVWDDLDRSMGQLFMMGWDGTAVTPSIRTMIEKHYLGNILLTAKNLKSAEEATRLIHELQTIAYNAGHPVPLTIALDQENGGVNSLYDEAFIRQFPSAMGVAATGSAQLAFDIARATALEISAVGVNWILGPVLDVLTNARNQPLGVRTTGDNPQEVSRYGIAYISGYKKAGIVTCGKHFPSYGNLEFLGSGREIPIITDTLEQLSLSALMPFRNAIAAGLDAMMVGGCALVSSGTNVMHACLSEQVVNELLRDELGFDGVILSACLEMESVIHHIGVGGGTVMAINAGCDIVVLCRSFSVQQDAMAGLKLGVTNGMISRDRIRKSLKRVLKMKSRCTSWQKALNPGGINYLSSLQPSHSTLSRMAYQNSITVVRDENHFIPLSNLLQNSDELLLLTPLVNPLPASAASKAMKDHAKEISSDQMYHHTPTIMHGEEMFSELGRLLARRLGRRVLHTSYTAHGVRPLHENLISRAGAVIILTADANRNLYQAGFTKHITMICNSQYTASREKREIPLIAVSISSPYDFAIDRSIGTYICTYDFTQTALESMVNVLFGDHTPHGALPGARKKTQKVSKPKQHWLVEDWLKQRDSKALGVLIKAVVEASPPQWRSPLSGSTSDSFILRNPDIDEAHFVVRNSSTQALYGFCSTYFYKESGTGVIGALFVDPARRNLSIGHSLHERAKRALMGKSGVASIQLGSSLPSIFLGLPADDREERQRLRRWFADRNWDTSAYHLIRMMIIRDLSNWSPPSEMVDNIQIAAVAYDVMPGSPGSGFASALLDHVRSNSTNNEIELYKLALADPKAYRIVRARTKDGTLLGCVILSNGRSLLAEYIPALSDVNEVVSGILSPVILTAVEEFAIVLQGLILYGIRMTQAEGLPACILDRVHGDANYDTVSAMGFTILRSFEAGMRPSGMKSRQPLNV